MELFDKQIIDVRKFILEGGGGTGPYREMQCAVSVEALLAGLPVPYSAHNPPSVLLKEDTFLELGHPHKGSVCALLWSKQGDLIKDGLVTLIGPDVPESSGQSLPFGQIILVGGSKFQEKDFAALEQSQNLGVYLRGYMVRQMPGKQWTRISHEAARNGFSFETLGRALMARYRERFPALEKIELLFVTASKTHLSELEEITKAARDTRLSLRGYKRNVDGSYECDNLSCETCDDKAACDIIRAAVVVRKKKQAEAAKSARDEAPAVG